MINRPINTLLPYSIVYLASHGDYDAIQAVLIQCRRYILKLCQKSLKDDDGRTSTHANEEMKLQLESKLISDVLCFDPT